MVRENDAGRERQILISLTRDEAQLLDAMARRECRLPSMQATYELRRVLNQEQRVPEGVDEQEPVAT